VICNVLEHRNNKYHFSHVLSNTEDWPTFKIIVCRVGRTFNVCYFSYMLLHLQCIECSEKLLKYV